MTRTFYIKDINEAFNFVGHSKLKPIDYSVLFKLKELSAALTESIGSSKVAKKRIMILLHLIQLYNIPLIKCQEKLQR